MSDPSSRKVIKSEGREMIARVYHYFQKELNFMRMNNTDKCDLRPLYIVSRRTALATGVSQRLVSKILQEERQLPLTGGQFISPMSNRRKRKCKTDLIDQDINAVRFALEKYSLECKKEPTLAQLKSLFEEKFGFNGCRNTLRTLLSKIGYRWRRIGRYKSNEKDGESSSWAFEIQSNVTCRPNSVDRQIYLDDKQKSPNAVVKQEQNDEGSNINIKQEELDTFQNVVFRNTIKQEKHVDTQSGSNMDIEQESDYWEESTINIKQENEDFCYHDVPKS